MTAPREDSILRPARSCNLVVVSDKESLMTNQPYTLLLALILLPLTAAPLSLADEIEDDDEYSEAERCINSRTIKSTTVIDDRNIVFYMRGSKIYRNILPRPCRGLSTQRRFSYTTVTRSLCDSDSIRILRETGQGFEEGRSCRLGRFHPTTEEDLNAFLYRLYETPKAIPPTLPEPQEVTGKDDEETSEEESPN